MPLRECVHSDLTSYQNQNYCFSGLVSLCADVVRTETGFYLVLRKQQWERGPQAGAVKNEGWSQVGGQAVLTDPRDVMRIWLFFQSTFHHVPSQQTLEPKRWEANKTRLKLSVELYSLRKWVINHQTHSLPDPSFPYPLYPQGPRIGACPHFHIQRHKHLTSD